MKLEFEGTALEVRAQMLDLIGVLPQVAPNEPSYPDLSEDLSQCDAERLAAIARAEAAEDARDVLELALADSRKTVAQLRVQLSRRAAKPVPEPEVSPNAIALEQLSPIAIPAAAAFLEGRSPDAYEDTL